MREAVMTNFVATKAIQVPNQGPPPDDFIALLLAFGTVAGDYVFEFNENNDIFSIIGPILGTVDPQTGAVSWPGGIAQRRAALLVALLYDAGFESSWNLQCGVDMEPGAGTGRPASEWEAGAWQVSQNSMIFDRTLLDLVAAHCGGLTDPATFQAGMKADKLLAVYYAGWLFRYDTEWSGPCDSGDLAAAMSVENGAQAIAAMNELMALIAAA
jgi:hypothetical protein